MNLQERHGLARKLPQVGYIFHLPKLQSLTLVNADLRLSRPDPKFPRPKTAPLHQLSLDSCFVDFFGFQNMLAAPRALRVLRYTQNNTWGTGSNLEEEMETFQNLIACTIAQRRSLTTLTMTFNELSLLLKVSWTKDLNFADLSSVKHLEIKFWANLKVRPEDVKLSIPDTLKSLRYVEGAGRRSQKTLFVLVEQHLKVPPAQARRSALRQIEISFSPEGGQVPPVAQVEFSRLGARLKADRNIRFLVYRRARDRKAVPYLYGEHMPEELLVYDSFSTEWLWRTKAQVEIEDEAARKSAEEAWWKNEAERRKAVAIAHEKGSENLLASLGYGTAVTLPPSDPSFSAG